MPILRPGMDIITVTLDTTEDTMDTADTTDTPTDMDMDTVTWERDPLMLNPLLLLDLKLKLMPKPNLKLMLPLRLRLNPGTDTMVDTTDIPTDTDTTDIPTDMVVTGGRFLSLPKSPAIFSIPY